MSHGDTIPLHPSSQSDIDEIENLINVGPATVLPARPPSPARASIPVSSSPFIPSNLPHPPPSAPPAAYQKAPTSATPSVPSAESSRGGIAAEGFGSPPNTLTEPVWDTVRRDLSRIVSNLKLVVFPNPFREDPGKALRDWDLWGPFFFIVFLRLTLSWSASVKKVRSQIHLRDCFILSCLFGRSISRFVSFRNVDVPFLGSTSRRQAIVSKHNQATTGMAVTEEESDSSRERQ